MAVTNATSLDQHLYEWIRVANERRERYGFPAGLVESRVHRMKQSLGDPYLLAIFEGHEPLHILGLRGQELDRWLRGGAYVDQNVIRVIEFASYLESFKDDQCLISKILKLKRDRLPPTLFELAMAFRLSQAIGEKGQVRLSCESEDAFGDFVAALGSRKIICECASLEFGEGEEERYRLSGDLYRYIESKAKRLSLPICLKIRIDAPFTPAVFSATVQVLKRLLEHAEDTPQPKTLEVAGVSASIEPLTEESERIPFRYEDGRVTDVLGTDWVSANSLSYVPEGDDKEVAEKHRRGEDLEEQEYARTFLKFPRNKADLDPYARVGNKIKKKISQTHIPEGYTGRIILLESPWNITLMDEPRLHSVIDEKLRGSSKTVAVVLCQRCHNPHYRDWYLHFGLSLGAPFAQDAEIRDCLTRMVTYDRDFDPILNERYIRTWSQAQSIAEQHEKEWQELQRKRDERL